MRNALSLAWTLARRGADPGTIVNWLEYRRALRGCTSLLDVGCGPESSARQLGFERLVGIDGYPPSVATARRDRTHDEVLQGDIRELDTVTGPAQFDACMALDVIEHLSKEDGHRLMESMERASRKLVLFFTPKGFLPQHHAASDDLQEHLSGWEPHEMRARGYRVVGMLGPKKLRGEYHRLKYRPRVFWSLVSVACHFLWTRWHPESAAAILCIKRTNHP